MNLFTKHKQTQLQLFPLSTSITRSSTSVPDSYWSGFWHLRLICISYKWSHTAYALFLTPFTQKLFWYSSIFYVINGSLFFFLLLNNIWLHQVCCNLFIHTLPDRHLACFHFCSVTNKPVVNIYVQAFLWMCVFIYVRKYVDVLCVYIIRHKWKKKKKTRTIRWILKNSICWFKWYP